MTEWIGIGIVVISFIVTIAVLWGKFSARMDNAEKILEKQNLYHTSHFDSIRNIENLAAAVGQHVKDHEKTDDDRFARIEAMFKEIREALRK